MHPHHSPCTLILPYALFREWQNVHFQLEERFYQFCLHHALLTGYGMLQGACFLELVRFDLSKQQAIVRLIPSSMLEAFRTSLTLFTQYQEQRGRVRIKGIARDAKTLLDSFPQS